MDHGRLSRGTLTTLIAATGVTALALWLGIVRHLEPYGTTVELSWWALALGFAAAELFVVRAHVRGAAHALTLSELPLVLGLVLAAPNDLMIAIVVGPAVVLVLTRGLAPLRLLFNVVQFALTGAVAVIALHRFTPAPAPVDPELWAAVFAAVLVASVVAALLVFCARGLSDGAVPSRRLLAMLGADLVVALANTSLALAGATIIAEDRRAIWLLALPAALLLFAYRAYASERAKHQSLEFLRGVTRSRSRGRELDSELRDLLRRALTSFRVRRAELVLFLDAGARRTSLTAGGEEEVMVELASERAAALRSAVGDSALIVGREDGPAALRAYLDERGIAQALVAPVRQEGRLSGAIVLGDRVGSAPSFAHEDRRLLETLADHTGLSLELDRLERQAESDPLTGLANRALFMQRVGASLAREDGTTTVLFLDLDDFKAINDSTGHAAGDAVLVAVARRLEASLRPHDIAARMGGDEFAVLLEDVDDHHADHVAGRVLDLLSGPIAVDGAELWVRSSIGIASVAAGSADVVELLRQADVAMYRAKAAGKGQVRVWSPELGSGGRAAAPGHDELAAALEGGELLAVFQPIVALDTGALVAVEALARWRHPRHGLLGPASFMPAAEASGLLGAVDREVLRQACQAAASGLVPAVHVNLSAPAVEMVEEALLATGLDPARLVLELSEPALASAEREDVQRLRRIGVQIAFDDFGTGPAALDLLREHPLDLVKVARPFVDGAGRTPHDRALLVMVKQVAELFGARVVAEGIERVDQRDALIALGCPLGQGHLFGRPAPLAAVSVA